MPFRHAVGGFLHQLYIRVRLSVEFLIYGRVIQAEICRQINHAYPGFHQSAPIGDRDTVRQCQECCFCTCCGNGFHIRIRETQICTRHMLETREHIAQLLPCILAGGGADQLYARVAQQNSQKLLASVSAGSYNGCFYLLHRKKNHIMKKMS